MKARMATGRVSRQQIDERMERFADALLIKVTEMVAEAGGTEAYVALQKESTPMAKLSKLFASGVSHLENINA